MPQNEPSPRSAVKIITDKLPFRPQLARRTAVTQMGMEREGKQKHVEFHATVLLISPELQTNKFKNRIYALDEIDLLISGGARFHPLFQQIGFLLARYPSRYCLTWSQGSITKG